MTRSLFLLTVMGQIFFSSCGLYEYHLINEGKTWDDAQNHCRDGFTDLATVVDMADLKSLKDLMKKEGVENAWIGLHSQQGKDNRKWHWSLPGIPEVELDDLKTYFWESEPNDFLGPENCVENKKGELNDKECNAAREFVCFNEATKESIVIPKNMNWIKAQKFCREHQSDLIGGLDQVKKLVGNFQSEKLWIGLFRDTWRWSDGSNSSFRNWEKFEDGVRRPECATVLKSSGEWIADDCKKKQPFFCYHDKFVLVTKNLTWDEAIDHCREHHHDLVSITNPDQQRWVQATARRATTSYVWLGLRYTCSMDLWFWVSDHLVCYSNWKDTVDSEDQCVYAAAMETAGAYEWVKKADTEKFNFICARKEA